MVSMGFDSHIGRTFIRARDVVDGSDAHAIVFLGEGLGGVAYWEGGALPAPLTRPRVVRLRSDPSPGASPTTEAAP